ncbi:hypothetical protein MHU86_8321 [Fragilaria crotonensis]|nr:hypothetical protein MHU86_8321 [Fragilaria crotonensis]
MDWALNKFRARVESKQWCQKTTEETINALQAQQVKKLLLSARADKKNKGRKERKSKFKSNCKVKASDKKGSSSDKWKKVAPKAGISPTKQVGRKEWHWCSKHKEWTKHKELECMGTDFMPSYDGAKKVYRSVFLLDDKQVTHDGGYSLQNKNHFQVCSVF